MMQLQNVSFLSLANPGVVMVDPAVAAATVKQLLEATGVSGGKPVLLVGSEHDRSSTIEALATLSNTSSINLNIHLVQALIDASDARVDIVSTISALEPSSPVLLLDRIQILMLPQLMFKATDVLCRVARRRSVCASWPGRLDRGRLLYADPNHPEFLDEDASRALVIDLSINESAD